jgi:hypothetical protein
LVFYAEHRKGPKTNPPYSLWLYAFMALPYISRAKFACRIIKKCGIVGFIAKAMQMAYGSAIN